MKPARAVALIVFILLVIGCGWTYFGPIGTFVRKYGEAEPFVDELVVPFKNAITSTQNPDIESVVNELLLLDQYKVLKESKMDVELQEDELIRFHINEMFDVGVSKDGGILWHQR